jgi:hypothetical protein
MRMSMSDVATHPYITGEYLNLSPLVDPCTLHLNPPVPLPNIDSLDGNVR